MINYKSVNSKSRAYRILISRGSSKCFIHHYSKSLQMYSPPLILLVRKTTVGCYNTNNRILKRPFPAPKWINQIIFQTICPFWWGVWGIQYLIWGFMACSWGVLGVFLGCSACSWSVRSFSDINTCYSNW